MNLLVRLPNWIGDAAMATPALDNLFAQAPHARVVGVASPAVAELLRDDRRFVTMVTDTSKQDRVRLRGMWRLARYLRNEYGPFDLSVSFLNSMSSRLFVAATGARQRVGRRHGVSDLLLTRVAPFDTRRHQVENFNEIVNCAFGANEPAGPMRLNVPEPRRFPRRTVGLSPGAAYGSAKRWPAERFAEVAVALAREADLLILGSPKERELAGMIERALRAAGATNYRNLAGATDLREFVATLAGLDLLIANDSGPLHLGAALQVPTVAIYGPTDPEFSRPWGNDRVAIVNQPVPCAPCHRRECPLGHHACMKNIETDQVIAAARKLLRTQRLAAAS